MDIEEFKYPIGKYNPGEIKFEMIKGWIDELRTFPQELSKAVEGISDESLMYTYRHNGWNIRQLVHMNSIIRFKLALTEDNPTIKPYLEAKWALMHDVDAVPIAASLSILEGVHARLSSMLSDMDVVEFSRKYTHPEHG